MSERRLLFKMIYLILENERLCFLRYLKLMLIKLTSVGKENTVWHKFLPEFNFANGRFMCFAGTNFENWEKTGLSCWELVFTPSICNYSTTLNFGELPLVKIDHVMH